MGPFFQWRRSTRAVLNPTKSLKQIDTSLKPNLFMNIYLKQHVLKIYWQFLFLKILSKQT